MMLRIGAWGLALVLALGATAVLGVAIAYVTYGDGPHAIAYGQRCRTVLRPLFAPALPDGANQTIQHCTWSSSAER